MAVGFLQLQADHPACDSASGCERAILVSPRHASATPSTAPQALGWTLFSSTVLVLLALAKQLLAGVGYCLRCWALAAGALMMATQLVSLRHRTAHDLYSIYGSR